jgi:hypothetical protein
MNKQFHENAWYGKKLVTGEFVRLYPKSHLETHLGRVELPHGETFGPLYLDCTTKGGIFKFSGQAHDVNDLTLEWSPAYEGGWRFITGPCIGVNPVIYDNEGKLVINNGIAGVNGWRFITEDNRPVSGDATYGPNQGLSEWSLLGKGMIVGQTWANNRDDCAVWDGAALRLVEAGPCKSIRADVLGDRITIGFWKHSGSKVLGFMSADTTFSDIKTLPLVAIDTPQPDEPNNDEPKGEDPVPFTPIRLPDQAQDIVVALYNRHKDLAHGDDDQRRALTQKIAEQVRFNLGAEWGWKKAGGPPSKDSIAKREGAVIHGFDLFNGATREPNDRPMSVDISAQTFIEVATVNHLGVTSEPNPDPKPDTELVKRLEAAEQAIASLRNDLRNFVNTTAQAVTQINDLALGLAEAVEELKTAPQRRFRIKGTTKKSAFHVHDIDLEAVEIK